MVEEEKVVEEEVVEEVADDDEEVLKEEEAEKPSYEMSLAVSSGLTLQIKDAMKKSRSESSFSSLIVSTRSFR